MQLIPFIQFFPKEPFVLSSIVKQTFNSQSKFFCHDILNQKHTSCKRIFKEKDIIFSPESDMWEAENCKQKNSILVFLENQTQNLTKLQAFLC